MRLVAAQQSKLPLSSILLTIVLIGLLAFASGCCGPRGCAVTCPPDHAYVYAHHGHDVPHHYAEHFTHPAPRQYAEPQWPYYDTSGTPRIMGDTRLRSHLGVAATPGEVAE
tara:strand:- start:20799 stop:21131 length:333 start_codon:yes stop_codon:yes gene_type:complete